MDPTSSTAEVVTTAPKRDRTHWLYVSVVVAVVAGIVVGLVAPDAGLALKPLGTGFVALIKMMISPIIFCTIVVGVGSVRQAAKVGLHVRDGERQLAAVGGVDEALREQPVALRRDPARLVVAEPRGDLG